MVEDIMQASLPALVDAVRISDIGRASITCAVSCAHGSASLTSFWLSVPACRGHQPFPDHLDARPA
jgi:hypothetical protein